MSNLSWTPCLYYTTDSLYWVYIKKKTLWKEVSIYHNQPYSCCTSIRFFRNSCQFPRHNQKKNTERERVALWCRLTYFWGFVFGNKRQILDNKLWSAFPFTIFHCWITNPFGVGDKRHFSQSFPYLHHL